MTAPLPIVATITFGTAGASTAITANITSDPAQWTSTYVTLSENYVSRPARLSVRHARNAGRNAELEPRQLHQRPTCAVLECRRRPPSSTLAPGAIRDHRARLASTTERSSARIARCSTRRMRRPACKVRPSTRSPPSLRAAMRNRPARLAAASDRSAPPVRRRQGCDVPSLRIFRAEAGGRGAGEIGRDVVDAIVKAIIRDHVADLAEALVPILLEQLGTLTRPMDAREERIRECSRLTPPEDRMKVVQ